MRAPGFLTLWLGILVGSTGSAQVTQRVSLDSSGAQANGDSTLPTVSADCRYVVFFSRATNLVSGDTNGKYDVFVRDRASGTTERLSVGPGDAQADDSSFSPSISADGRYVAFDSDATNLVPGDTNGTRDVFVRDRQNGATERVSVDPGGAEGNQISVSASISADGRFVAFSSAASNLVPGDSNGSFDAFVCDRQSGTTELVTVSSSGVQGNGFLGLLYPSISADGRYVAFASDSTNLVPGDTNGRMDVFVRDRQYGVTKRVSVDSNGVQANADCGTASISADGRCVVFRGWADNLVPGDTNGAADIFVHDRQSGTTERVSVGSGGTQGNYSSRDPSISGDGRYAAFASLATNLVPSDTNRVTDIFLRDRQDGTTERISVDSGWVEGSRDSFFPSLSPDGRYVAFESYAKNLAPGDTGPFDDVFVRDRLGGTTFTSLCDAGVGGVVACPCSNPPIGTGRGCDNSAATGGAVLGASGGTYLSSDSLVFTTLGQKPTALSIVLQGTALASSGLVFGQGVRCTSGALLHLYVKTAFAGSITAPDFGAGDPTVSARSAVLGSVIQVGQSSWYLVGYRDPAVLGSCPSSSTFNATQTGRVTWSP